MARVLDQEDGLGLYALHLIKHLLTLDRESRYLILLRTAKHRHTFDHFANAETHVMPARSKFYWDQIAVSLLARRLGANLLFNAKFSVPLLGRTPSVFVLQSADWFVNPQNYPRWDRWYIRFMLPRYCAKAARLLAISHATVDDLARYGKLKVRNAVITYAGIGPHFTAERDTVALAQFHAQHALPDRFILTVTRVLHTGHDRAGAYGGGNIERLLRAYACYRMSTPNPLPLVVAGRAIEHYVRECGFTNAELVGVHFVGFVPNVQMPYLYQLAECFVLATLCESFGFPIVEALATGCAAIVPSTCASPEVAGGAARLIDPQNIDDIAQALLEVTGSERLRAQLQLKGLERARLFTWNETARRTLAVFDDVLLHSVSDVTRSGIQHSSLRG